MKKAKLQEEQLSDVVINWLGLFESDSSLHVVSSPAEFNIQNSELELQLFEYFSDVVPTLLEKSSGDTYLKYNISSDVLKEKICKQLDYFISGGVSDEGIKTLASYSKPQKFCGKVFNVGDLTYSCMTCAQDPTCVFCHFCFHNSVHKNHKHKLHASCGSGGYCDCGDEEAWTEDPACEYHKGGMNNDETWDPFSSLPVDIQCRATFVFLFVLQYIMELLVMEEYDDDEEKLTLPLNLSGDESDDSHIVMLYNDESHTYEDVITTLIESIKASRQQAYHFAAIVDKEGRSSIYEGAAEDSGKITADCKRLTTRNGKSPLKCKSIHKNVVAHQLVALELTSWMCDIIEICDGLRRLLCLLTTVNVTGLRRNWTMPFLEMIIRQDTTLWKVAKARSHQLFMNVVLMDTLGRKEFAITFAKCYKGMIKDFIVDDHEHSISVAALSVQIFTVPSLANMLILDGNILKTCLEAFLDKVRPAIGKSGSLDFQEGTAAFNISRANYILNDVLYLLRHKPVWTPQFSTNFLDAFNVFVDILKLMQGMDPVVRKTQAHVTYEPNWETAFNLQLGMIPVIRAMLSWCHGNNEIFKAAVHRCVFTLRSLQPLKYTTVKKKLVVNHDVSTNSVSIHYALSRFLAALLPGSTKFGFGLHELLQMEQTPDDSTTKLQLQILEYPMRSLVLSAQVNAQMWKRNGYAIHHQAFCYHNVRFVSEMSDRDMLMLQVLSCVMDHDHFIKALLYKYHLINWSKGKPIDEKDKDKEAAEKESIMAKDFLMTVLYILSERYVSGVSNLTITQILEREVIHKLSLGPMSRSALIKNLPFKDHSEDEDDSSFESLIDGILKDVAVYREPGVTGKGVFELKEDLIIKCSKYLMHYTKTEQSKMAEEKKRIIKKLAKSECSFLHPPPKFNEHFENIINLVCCDSLLKLMRVVLSKAVKEDRFAEDHAEEVLMIIAIGLMEVKRLRGEETAKHFNFLELLQKEKSSVKSIVSLIDELVTHTSKECYATAKWVKRLLQEEIEIGVISMDVDKVDTVTVKEDGKAEKATLAAERKKKMMEQINQMQKAFMVNNSNLFDMCDEDDEMEEDIVTEDLSHPVAIGDKHSVVDNTCMSVLCILCQEKQSIDCENYFVVTSFVHKSNVIKTDLETSRESLVPELSKSNMVNVSSCGHIVHIQCWEKYFSSVKERENLPYFQRRSRSCIDVTQTEYLCPLCNSLCNTVLPLLPRAIINQYNQDDESEDVNGGMGLSEFLSYLERFSSGVMSTPKKGVHPPSSRPNVALYVASVFSSLLASSYSGSNSGAQENSMELFARKLMMVFGVEKTLASYSVPYSWMACSFTLQAYECSARVDGSNIFANISDRKDKFWYAFIQYLANNCMIGVYEPAQDIGNVLFNFFCGVDHEISLSILDADIFSILISLRFLVGCIQNIFQEEEPKLMNTSSCVINDVVFKICLVAHLVKIYLTAPLFVADENSISEDDEDENVVKSWLFIQSLIHENPICTINSNKLKEHVLESLLPFMRCSAIFFHYLTGVKLPDTLAEGDPSVEISTLQNYLNLPDGIDDILSLEVMTSEPMVKGMIERWCRHKDVIQLQKEKLTSVPCFVQARRLIRLPKDYSSLINRVSGFMCPTLKNDSSRVPALCLVCDTVLCSNCYCCVKQAGQSKRYGACSIHSMECCSGIGIFLRIRDSEIVLMYNQSKITFLPSPYLDEYGETDSGFRRGNPLYLNEKRFERLEQLWLRQQIPETIAQAMESNRGPNPNEWNQL